MVVIYVCVNDVHAITYSSGHLHVCKHARCVCVWVGGGGGGD